MKKNPWKTISLKGTPFQLARCGYSTQAHLYDSRNKRPTGITICGDSITGHPIQFKRSYMVEPPNDCGICWNELIQYLEGHTNPKNPSYYCTKCKRLHLKGTLEFRRHRRYVNSMIPANPGAEFHKNRSKMFLADAARMKSGPYKQELLRLGYENAMLSDYSKKGIRNPKGKSLKKWIVPVLILALGVWYLNRNKS